MTCDMAGPQKSTAAEAAVVDVFLPITARGATLRPARGCADRSQRIRGGALRHAFDGRGQSALVPRSFVLVDDVLVGDRVNRARGTLKHGLRCGFVACLDCAL